MMYTEEDFEDTAAGRFALRSMMNVNQFYSENMAEDIRLGLMDNAKNCKVNGALPYGYKKGGDGSYAIHEDQAVIVQEIFQRVANGEALSAIADSLNSRRISNKQGRPWGKNSFKLLSNERYLGTYIYSDVRIPHGIPQIISDDLYQEVQEALTMKRNPRFSKTRKSPGNYLLTGKIFCGDCRSPMVGISGKGEHGVVYRYYACKKKREKHTCDKKLVPKELLEVAVGKTIQDYALSDNAIDWMVDCALRYQDERRSKSDVYLIEEKLASVEKSIQNLVKSLESGIVLQSVTERIKELESKKQELLASKKEAESEMVDLDRNTLIQAMKIYQKTDINDSILLKRLLDTFLICAYIHEDDTLEIAFSLTGKRKDVTTSLKYFEELENKKVLYKPTPQGEKSLYKNIWWR